MSLGPTALNILAISFDREPVVEFKLELHGNKRNEENEMYRKRLVDEVNNFISMFTIITCKAYIF